MGYFVVFISHGADTRDVHPKIEVDLVVDVESLAVYIFHFNGNSEVAKLNFGELF